MNIISLIIYENDMYSSSVEIVVTISLFFEDHDTRFELI